MTDYPASWDSLDEVHRQRILGALNAAAKKRTEDDKDLYGTNTSNDPKVEILDCAVDGDSITVRYVFDWWLWCPAQSGSDWNYHYIYSGTAAFEGDKLASNKIVEHVRNRVSEYDEKDYDTGAAVDKVRAKVLDSI